MKLVVTANSPGEVTWLKSIARTAQRHYGVSIEVLLYPCSFATGREAEVAAALPGVARVHPWSSYPRLLLWEGKSWDRDTRILHLGGDLMYTALLGWRWGWNCWSYLWSRPWWDSAFRGYLTRDAQGVAWLERKRVAQEKIHVVGDLVVDAVLGDVPEEVAADPDLIALLPGSRDHEAAFGVPLFLGVAERMWHNRPQVRFRLFVSPFLLHQENALEKALTHDPEPRVGGVRGHLEIRQERPWLVTPSGLAVEVICQGHMQALAPAQLALSLPGTKMAEAATLGVPCLMVVPLNCPELLPSIGLLGLLDWIPGGAHLKGRLLMALRPRLQPRMGLLAQPNQRAGRAVMPELIDVMTPESIAQEMESLLADPDRLQEARGTLRGLYRPLAGAAHKMLRQLLLIPPLDLPENGLLSVD